MSKVCATCGKKPMSGQNIRHKHSKGWALRAPRTKRRYMPNLQPVRTEVDGEIAKLYVCTKCLKAGKVTRAA